MDYYEVNYLSSPDGLYGIAVKKNNDPIQLYFVETDRLDSILALYVATTLQQTYAQSFDAPALSFVEGSGRELNPTDWTYSLPFQSVG